MVDTLLAFPVELELFGEEDLTDAKAELLLANASGIVRDYCGWRLDRATEDLVVDVVDAGRVLLPSLYVRDVEAVLLDDVEMASTDWAWSFNGQLAFVGSGARLTVTLDHGYDPVPPAVRAVVLALALRMHLNPAGHGSEAAPGGVQTGFGGGVLNSGGLLDREMQVLDRYRVPGRP